MFTFYLHLLFTLSAFFSFKNNTVNIDVLDYQIHIKEIDFEAQTLKAQTRIRFKMTDLNTAQAEFSLIGFTIDSCYFNGEDIDFTHENNKIIFNLPENRKSGDIYRFYVFYQGKPAKDKYWGGFFIEDEMAYNYGVGMEAVPPVYGRAWFPCHDVFTDRALYTIIIDAPKGFGAVANGILKTTKELATTTQYTWELSDSIPTYLVSVAISKFDILKDEYTSGERQIPIEIYVPKGDAELAENTFEKLKEGLHAYETLFGPYVWERVGYVATPFDGGAMEHATNIAYSRNCHTEGCESTIYHELSHHWFGDLVTCKTEKDMWLNEGWACYSEYLYFEQVYGYERAQKHLALTSHKALKYAPLNDGGYIALNNPTHDQTYGTNIYKKGAMMVHNLRFELGDSAFFAVTKEYLKAFAFKNATIKDLQHFYEKESGIDLQYYFTNWIETEGYANYFLEDYQVEEITEGINLHLKIRQQQLARKYWATNQKIELMAIDKQGEKHFYTVVANGELTEASILLNFKPKYVILDPNNRLCDAQFSYSPYIRNDKPWNNDDVYLRLLPRNLSKDSLQAHITYNYVQPYLTDTTAEFSTEYWRVDIPESENQQITAWFYLPPQLKLRNLYYRKNVHTDWQALNNQSKKYTEFKINRLRSGEYAFGKL